MRALRRTGVALAALVLFLVVGELAARLWVDHVAQRGKLFRHDVETGTTNETRATSLGDLDADGDLDLITGNQNSQVGQTS